MPEGQPAPRDSSLPEQARSELPQRPLGIYIHVPFCTTRCGYCDFNTYTAAELGSEPGASRTGYIDAAIQELGIAARVLGPDAPPVSTIFVGGGTPTVLPPDDLGRLVAAVRSHFGLAPDAEVTTESNPESIDFAGLQRLRELGFNRISFGMQSAVPQVLATLDRTHTPGRPIQAVTDAKAAGFANISLDLIYGTPGESASDWLESLEAALSAAPQHISAYALIVEDGTRLAARIRRGELPPTDEDDLADKYLIADDRFTAAGYTSVRGEQLVPECGDPLSPQSGLLAKSSLVGRRPRSAQPCGRGALVEPQASAGVRIQACFRPITGSGPRAAVGGATTNRAHPARASPR